MKETVQIGRRQKIISEIIEKSRFRYGKAEKGQRGRKCILKSAELRLFFLTEKLLVEVEVKERKALSRLFSLLLFAHLEFHSLQPRREKVANGVQRSQEINCYSCQYGQRETGKFHHKEIPRRQVDGALELGGLGGEADRTLMNQTGRDLDQKEELRKKRVGRTAM